MRLADCGCDVWVGGLDACDAKAREFDRVVHCWRPQHFELHTCRAVRERRAAGMLLECWERQPLRPEQRAELRSYAAGPGRLLVHCAAGQVRSATAAVLCLMARGVDPFEALGRVWKAVASYGGDLFDNLALNAFLEGHGG